MMYMNSKNMLRGQAIGLLFGLCIQFLLGMAINVFVSYPTSGDAGVMWEFTKRQPLVMVHIIWGTLLVIGATVFVVRSVRGSDALWKRVSVLGLVFALVAWVSGERFVSTQQDVYSFTMAVAFIAAILAYVWGISRTAP